MMQTPRERVIAQIEHRETDPVPYTLLFEPIVEKRLDAHFGGPIWQARMENAIVHVPGLTADTYVERTSAPETRDLYGSLWRWSDDFPHLIEPAISQPSLQRFTFPEMETLFAPGWKERSLVEIERNRDRFRVVGFSFGLFERSWALCGFDNVLLYMATEPTFYEELVAAVAEHQMQIVEKLVTLPVDGIMFGDDWGYQDGLIMGAKRWRRFFKPHLTRLYACAHSAGKRVLSHCCGGIHEILPDLIEIGLDVYESVQPEAKNNSPYALKKEFGADLTFWGGLGVQSTIPFGTPEAIRAEVARLRTEMSRGGGYILSAAKPIQPETPLENALAVLDAFTQP
jgi:uroporphyrinogen decarboxylase